MNHLRRMRRFLGVLQRDVERATGIPVYRLSAFENGRMALTQPELTALTVYLQDRVRIVAEVEGSTYPKPSKFSVLGGNL